MSPAVIAAFNASRQRNQQLLSVQVRSSDDIEANSGRISAHSGDDDQQFVLLCDPPAHNTSFPRDPRLHAKTYKVKVTHPEDIITFWAVETELVELQSAIESKIEQCRQKGKLSGFRGEVAANTLVAAPFENDDNSVSYFRALVLCNRVWRNHTTDNCLVRYVDYGNIECVSSSELRALPNEPLPNSERSIVDVEFLAVKYREGFDTLGWNFLN